MSQSEIEVLAQQNSALSALVLAQQRELEALHARVLVDFSYKCAITKQTALDYFHLTLYITYSIPLYGKYSTTRDVGQWTLYIHDPRWPYVAIRLDDDRILLAQLAQRQQGGQPREEFCEMFPAKEGAPLAGELRFERKRGAHECANPSDCNHAFQIVRQHGQPTRLSRRALTCVLQQLFRFCARENSNACKEICAIAKHFEIFLE